MLWFNFAQTFYVDRSAVKNATEVALTRVDLFFRALPPPTNNKSGITKPGVEVKIVPCLNGIPVINQMGAYRPTEPTEHGAKFAFYSGGQTGRAEYDQIQASASSNVPTPFMFHTPVFVKTDHEYAIIVKFDGNENFVLWTSKAGHKLVGTNETSTGPSSKFVGTLYHYIDDPNAKTLISSAQYGYSNTTIDPAQANNPALVYTSGTVTVEQTDTKYLQANWTPVPAEDLKFKVYAARYFINGVSVATIPEYVNNAQLSSTLDRFALIHTANDVVSNGVIRLTAPAQTTEYIVFDMKNTVRDNLMYGEPFYQDGPSYPGGTDTPLTVTCYPSITGNVEVVSRTVQANGSYLLPGNITFNSVGGFSNLFSTFDFLLIKEDANTFHIRQIDEIVSNTEIVVDSPFSATITGAEIMRVPMGYLNDVSKDVVLGRLTDTITLYNSTANDTVRFVGHSLAGVTINDGGTGYSNDDYIYVTGYEDDDTTFSVKGNYTAFANVVTDANGTITSILFSNNGAGFVNTNFLVGANVVINQSADGEPSNSASAGTGANLTFTVGSTIKSAFRTTSFGNCEIINLEVMRMKPEITVNNPLGTSFTIRHRTLYHSIRNANNHSGRSYYIDTPAERVKTDTYCKIFKAHNLNVPAEGKTPVLTSRSNEYAIRFANGDVNTVNTYGYFFSNTAVFIFDVSSNSDYQTVFVDPEIVMSHYGKYVINQEYTDEHTNYGQAFAKHVATKINLARVAEDMLVYLTAYRPANTDIKVYARLHNSRDEQAFDDTDWTKLELIDGKDMYSSRDNTSDYVELTYNLPAFPNTDFTMSGTVTLTQGNLHVTGNSTIFGPRTTVVDGGSGFVNGDVVSFTAPLNIWDDGDTPIFAYKRAVNATFAVTTNATGGVDSLTINAAGYGWANQGNVTAFTVRHANGANNADATANLVYNPGLQSGDMIKVYSPYVDFANTSYTIAIVDTVVNNTDVKVLRTFGQVGANLAGNVSINTTSAVLEGTGTQFNQVLSVGDFIAIWSNSSVYETHQIVSITDADTLTMDSNGTFANTAAKYAYVTPDAFLNTSISLSNLLVDRLAYPHQAFNNIMKDNVARYYNASTQEFDGFDTFQIKVVLLSDSDMNVPRVDDVRGIAVSA